MEWRVTAADNSRHFAALSLADAQDRAATLNDRIDRLRLRGVEAHRWPEHPYRVEFRELSDWEEYSDEGA